MSAITVITATVNGTTLTLTPTAGTTVQVVTGGGSSSVLGLTYTTKSADYTLAAGEAVDFDASGGAKTATVPNTAGVITFVGKIISDNTLNPVTIQASSGGVDGGSELLYEKGSGRYLLGTGSGVRVIGERKPFGSVGTGRVRSNTQTANYTLVISDDSKVVEMNKSTAVTLTIPPTSSVAWVVGTTVEVYAMGAGQVTIAAGSGVTLRAPNGAKSAHQYATIGLRCRATDEWVVSGDTTT